MKHILDFIKYFPDTKTDMLLHEKYSKKFRSYN